MKDEQIRPIGYDDGNGVEFGAFWGAGLHSRVIPKIPVIEHFLYRNDVAFLVADAGVGKSIMALQIMANLTTGTPFLGTYKVVKPCNVCYLQTEGDRAETLERMEAIGKGLGIDYSRVTHINLPGIALNTPDGMGQFINLAKASGMQYDVIIIDPLYTTVKGSLSKDEVATDWIRNVREIKKHFTNCAILTLHHVPKDHWQDGILVAKTMFGSAFWKAYANYTYILTKVDGKHILTVEKRRNDKVGFDKLELKLVQPYPLYYAYAEKDPGSVKMKVLAVVQTSPEPLSAKMIEEVAQISRASVFRALKILLTEGRIRKHIDSNDNHTYEIGGDEPCHA
jgi:hypothetical protein